MGAVLLDGTRFREIASLTPDDFLLERHRSIFIRTLDHARGEYIDRVTVAEELDRHSELGPDGARERGIPEGVVLADAGYGNDTRFRTQLTKMEFLTWLVS